MDRIKHFSAVSQLETAFEDTLKSVTSGKEIDYIRAIASSFKKSLNPILKIINPSFTYTVKLKVIHQSPIVYFTSASKKKGCELGDLFLIYRETSGGVSKCQAMLLQAKRTNNIDSTNCSNQKQLELYTQWPRFKIGQKGKTTYDLFPKHEHPGAKYLLISEENGTTTLWIARPEKNLSSYQSFAKDVIDLTQFQTGMPLYLSRNHQNNGPTGLIISILTKDTQITTYDKQPDLDTLLSSLKEESTIEGKDVKPTFFVVIIDASTDNPTAD